MSGKGPSPLTLRLPLFDGGFTSIIDLQFGSDGQRDELGL